jgi:hypothetical protein
MTKPRPPSLRGLDTLLQEQALEMVNLRAARGERRAKNGAGTPKSYRLGQENPDGTFPIDVADRGADNWRERETHPTEELAQKRIQQLIAADAESVRGLPTPDGDQPRSGNRGEFS